MFKVEMNKSIVKKDVEVHCIATSYKDLSKINKKVGKRACRHWTTKGFCPYNERCLFSHTGPRPSVIIYNKKNEDAYPVLSSISEYTKKVLPAKEKIKFCRYFTSGNCKAGENCKFLHKHPKFKTEDCRYYLESGYCKAGEACTFIHDENMYYKSHDCKHYIYGNCLAGEDCKFFHDEQERFENDVYYLSSQCDNYGMEMIMDDNDGYDND